MHEYSEYAQAPMRIAAAKPLKRTIIAEVLGLCETASAHSASVHVDALWGRDGLLRVLALRTAHRVEAPACSPGSPGADSWR